MSINPRTPVLVGVGQVVNHWSGINPDLAPNPSSLRYIAALAALNNSGARKALIKAIDRVVVVRTMLDSIPGVRQPFGCCENPPATLSTELGILGGEQIYSVVGGDQPQALVNEAAKDIFNGDATVVLLAGAEATAAMKVALKRNIKLDWSQASSAEMEDRGLGVSLLSAYEINNGLGMPTHTYPAFEHALRGRLGLSRGAYVDLMSELWAGFSDIAAHNPYAQFRTARSAGFLSTASPDNYPVADPYLKWHVAQDAVNQGAAIIMTSTGRATELGINPAQLIYLHGYAEVSDKFMTEREDLSRSQAIKLALGLALKSTHKSARDISHFDLYSCFPCAVLLAAEALQLDWRKTPATITGGLPFFGGAGNNYSMHAIATMVERLRHNRQDYGLVLANGGFLSKQAVGIYSALPKENWLPVFSQPHQCIIDNTRGPRLLSETVSAKVVTYNVSFSNNMPAYGYVIASNNAGRILARIRPDQPDVLATFCQSDMLGREVHIEHKDGVNTVHSIGDL